jgi:hypothetical protein
MKLLTKILGVGILTLASLTGCMKNYHINGKIVKYNDLLSTPMIVVDDSEKVSYQRTIKWNSLRATGKIFQ